MTLEAIGQDTELLKSIYLDDLDLNKAIQYANTLKANKAKVQSTETIPTPAPVEQPKTVAYTAPVIPTQQPEPTTLTRAFKVTASRDLIIELGEFMNQKGIIFEKIEL